MAKVMKYEESKDLEGSERLERACEVGPTGKMSLFTDMLGDPLCRVRQFPDNLMLVAEIGEDREAKEIVGLIRGCIQTVRSHNNDRYTKVAYVLGLRVSPCHRRLGIGFQLVSEMESWFREKGAEYSYMATDKDNEASVRLFTDKCRYTSFRTLPILVQPVFEHRVKTSKRVKIFKLTPDDAEVLYRESFSTVEFFPDDIDLVLRNEHNLGTFVAVLTDSKLDVNQFLSGAPESWAVLSIWNSKEVFTLELKGANRIFRGLVKATRAMDRVFPWLRIPSAPDIFRPFGSLFLYGIGGQGRESVILTKALCGFAHNLAKEKGCALVVAEIAGSEPDKIGAIPHWKRMSFEDLWCIKRLGEDCSDESVDDWTKSKPGPSIFVDPREI
ncbi:hypothetical protein MKW94_023147 [Papaver nudicaule]|uniref:N-acetyltransferase domain-containing protein n=1 Tax=Papaver nudicaule TaxID=74823 RepID=A0AA41V1P1_PAPNU|nr:hypothetical protein [Papaver nudicaule]